MSSTKLLSLAAHLVACLRGDEVVGEQTMLCPVEELVEAMKLAAASLEAQQSLDFKRVIIARTLRGG